MEAPRNRGPNTTLLSSITVEGMGPCLAVEGSTNAVVVFETYYVARRYSHPRSSQGRSW